MSYLAIWVDDERKMPIDVALKTGEKYSVWATTTNQALKAIKHSYKSGVRNFMLDMDNDSGDTENINGGDFINVLDTIDCLTYSGKMTNCHFLVRIHTGNSVARSRMRAIIEHNPYMNEVI